MILRDTVGIVLDRDFLRHKIPQRVLESPARLIPLYQRLDEPDMKAVTRRYRARAADEQKIFDVHSEMYIQQIRQHSTSDNPFAYDKDTYLMEETVYVATLAAGGCLVLADAIMEGEIRSGFAIGRPPGHHAGTGNGCGFCVFNNVAVVAKHLLGHYGLSRVLILDFDAHHGNGTEEIFWEDARVVTVSIHQENLFPMMSGAGSSIGGGEGRGYTVNIPVCASFGDAEYNHIVGQVVHELVRQFAPEFILVSAGFDGHADDPVSGLTLSTEWYHRIAKVLNAYSADYGINRLLYSLEGGYSPRILEQSVVATILGLCAPVENLGTPFSPRAAALLGREVLPYHREKWRFDSV